MINTCTEISWIFGGLLEVWLCFRGSLKMAFFGGAQRVAH